MTKVKSKKYDILEQMLDLSQPQTREGWLSAGQLGLDHGITVEDMVNHVDEREPSTEEDWTLRAELFETMLYLYSAIIEVKFKETK